jgi:endo-1,4-beta-xylanase
MVSWYYAFIPIVTKASILVGTAIAQVFFSVPGYTDHVADNYGLIVPEVEGKYDYYQEHGWSGMDEIVEFSEANGLDVHYHTLIWYWSLPPDSCAWITEAMTRYPTIHDWDVLNEHWTETGTTSSIDAVQVFECAREARPDARLWYNGVFSNSNEREHAVALMRAGLIDGIGIQFHIGLGWDISEQIKTIREIENYGGFWRVSELDIRLLLPPSPEDILAQAEMYNMITELCQNSKTCTDITVWGAADNVSWIRVQYPGFGMATPFDLYYQPKIFWERMQ